MSSTYTVNLGLRKPAHADPETINSWDAVVNTNMDYIDTAFGPRSYTGVPPNGWYIAASDSHSLSFNKLDLALKAVSINTPTADEKAALAGEGTPNVSNKYTTKDYVRVNRKEVLFPEYASGTFTPAPGGANTGTMTTNAEKALLSGVVDPAGGFIFNHYKWVATLGSLQSYDISVQWRVPETWLNWLTKALVVDICTELADAAECKVEAYIYKDGTAGIITSKLNNISTVGGRWYAERLNNEVISFSNAEMGTPVAGDTLNITVRVFSRNSRYVKIGAITIGYRG